MRRRPLNKTLISQQNYNGFTVPRQFQVARNVRPYSSASRRVSKNQSLINVDWQQMHDAQNSSGNFTIVRERSQEGVNSRYAAHRSSKPQDLIDDGVYEPETKIMSVDFKPKFKKEQQLAHLSHDNIKRTLITNDYESIKHHAEYNKQMTMKNEASKLNELPNTIHPPETLMLNYKSEKKKSIASQKEGDDGFAVKKMSSADIQIKAEDEKLRTMQSLKQSKQSYKSSSINMSLELRNIENNVMGSNANSNNPILVQN